MTPQTPGTPLIPGDLIEVETPAGLAYLHLSHNAAPYPPVVRALPRLHARRPADLAAMAAGPAAFVALIPLAESLARGALVGRRVAHAPIPQAAQAFPTFRTPIRDRTGAVVYWWLWDGTGLRWCDTDAAGIAQYPLREVLGARALLARLAALAPVD